VAARRRSHSFPTKGDGIIKVGWGTRKSISQLKRYCQIRKHPGQVGVALRSGGYRFPTNFDSIVKIPPGAYLLVPKAQRKSEIGKHGRAFWVVRGDIKRLPEQVDSLV
jgi:hypothetical protein